MPTATEHKKKTTTDRKRRRAAAKLWQAVDQALEAVERIRQAREELIGRDDRQRQEVSR